QEAIPMTPAANEGNLLQIVQGPGYVTLLHEIDHNTRVIPTDGRPHLPSNIRQWKGDSVGHWEGNTLVVDTTNFTGLTAYRGSSENLHLVERFMRTADDTMTYQFTVEDPTTWAKPWTAEIPWKKTKGPVYEYACHEGNTMIVTILRGARVADEQAAKKGKGGAIHANEAEGCSRRWGSRAGGGAVARASRVRGGIRSGQANQGAGIGHEVGADQSALVDLHRREGRRWKDRDVDDRRGQPQQSVQARVDEGVAAGRI